MENIFDLFFRHLINFNDFLDAEKGFSKLFPN